MDTLPVPPNLPSELALLRALDTDYDGLGNPLEETYRWAESANVPAVAAIIRRLAKGSEDSRNDVDSPVIGTLAFIGLTRICAKIGFKPSPYMEFAFTSHGNAHYRHGTGAFAQGVLHEHYLGDRSFTSLDEAEKVLTGFLRLSKGQHSPFEVAVAYSKAQLATVAGLAWPVGPEFTTQSVRRLRKGTGHTLMWNVLNAVLSRVEDAENEARSIADKAEQNPVPTVRPKPRAPYLRLALAAVLRKHYGLSQNKAVSGSYALVGMDTPGTQRKLRDLLRGKEFEGEVGEFWKRVFDAS